MCVLLLAASPFFWASVSPARSPLQGLPRDWPYCLFQERGAEAQSGEGPSASEGKQGIGTQLWVAWLLFILLWLCRGMFGS